MKDFRQFLLATASAAALFTAPLAASGQEMGADKTYGDGVAAYSLQQYERAAEIWQALAEAGDRESQYRLAMLYQDGRGVPQDLSAAAAWLTRAAEAGHGRAQYLLGNMYATGTGVEEDPLKAFDWYLRSANTGQARAQFHVAIQYLDGSVVDKSYLDAHVWFHFAAEVFSDGVDKSLALEARDKTFAALSEDEKAQARAIIDAGLPIDR